MDDDSPLWEKKLKKSIENNKQLAFANKATISIIDSINQIPLSEIYDLNSIYNARSSSNINQVTNGLTSALVFLFDNRCSFIKHITNFASASIAFYFPLTKEKYIIRSIAYINNSRAHNSNELPFKHFINSDLISELQKKEILKDYWSKLTREEKLLYETVDKDSIKAQSTNYNNDANDDVNKYIAQECIECSDNFSIGFFFPYEIEYTIFPMPQVIANTRKNHYESLLKPHKMPHKFLYKYDTEKTIWYNIELN